MRRLATICLGLALSAPATAWSQAYGPAPDLTLESEQHRPSGLATPEYQQLRQDLQQAQSMGATSVFGGHLCAKCARKLPTHIPAGPSTALSGAYGHQPFLARSQPQPVPPSPSGSCAMCQQAQTAGAGAPGVAYVGGPSANDSRYLGVVGSIEPLPVGVIRTNYNQITDPSRVTRAAYDPYMPAPSMMPPAAPVPAPMGAPMAVPGHRHTSVLAHMFGFRRHSLFGEARQEREREAHAMIRYNSNEAPPAQLPASMVYPR